MFDCLKLKQRRESIPLTQYELAALSGMDQSSYSRIERGLIREPRMDTLVRIAAALKCNVLDICDLSKYVTASVQPTLCQGETIEQTMVVVQTNQRTIYLSGD